MMITTDRTLDGVLQGRDHRDYSPFGLGPAARRTSETGPLRLGGMPPHSFCTSTRRCASVCPYFEHDAPARGGEFEGLVAMPCVRLPKSGCASTATTTRGLRSVIHSRRATHLRFDRVELLAPSPT